MISKNIEQLPDGRYIIMSYKPSDGYNKFGILSGVWIVVNDSFLV